MLAIHVIPASNILKDEAMMWLKAIHRRLARKQNIATCTGGKCVTICRKEFIFFFIVVYILYPENIIDFGQLG